MALRTRTRPAAHSAAAALTALLAGLSLPVASAEASVDERARPVLEHLVRATGGAAARQSERTLHVVGRIRADGLTGRWELWLAAPDRWARSFALGPLRYREGFDGRGAWHTDLTARDAVPLSAPETERAREEGWFLNERWALDGQDGGAVRWISSTFGEEASYDEIEITPPAGQPRLVFVNQRTGFIERVISRHDQYQVKDLPGAYRTLAGRKRATVYKAPTLLPGDTPVEELTVDSVAVNPPLDPSRFACPAAARHPVAWSHPSHAVRLPIRYVSHAVLVPVSVDGAAPEEFILDTGASLTTLDEEYARRLGLVPQGEAQVEGVAEMGGVRYARIHSIATRDPRGRAVTVRDFRAAVMDLSRDAQILLWRKPAGILGADFLSQFALGVDYDSLRVTLEDPARFRADGRGAALPFELREGVPVVDVSLDAGCTGRFIVDVGNSFHFVVHGSRVRSCEILAVPGRRRIEVAGGGVGGGFISTLCRLDSVRLGPYAWAQPVAALVLHTTGGFGSTEIGGNIGNTVLERFRCTFDYARRVLYLAPGRRYGERERVSRFGALLLQVGTRVYAGDVLRGSAADEAGLRWYDQIVAVDGRPLQQWTREEVDRSLEEGELGSVHRVTIRRFDDPPRTLEVKLKDVL